MGKLTISRRSFIAASTVMGAAAALSTAVQPGHFQAWAADSSSADTGIKRIRTCCRGCGKMECGVWVTVENGRAVKIEGDESAFQSRGNCCCKSQSSLQAAYHPDRLYHPLKRTNPKGEEPGWVRVSWAEAWDGIGKGFTQLIEKYGPECTTTVGGTSRAWAMGAYAGIKVILGTPNSVEAAQICKGPRFQAGAMIDQGGSYWMPVREEPRVYLQWGTAVEASNYDDSCRNAVDAASRADVHILIDPREGGLGKEADYWLQIRPGTDHAIALAWQKIILDEGLWDQLFVKRWSNAPMLVVEDMEPSGGYMIDNSGGGIKAKTKLLKESDLVDGGSYQKFMVWDNTKAAAGATGNDALSYLDVETTQWEGENKQVPSLEQCEYLEQYEGYWPPVSQFDSIDPALEGEFEVTLKDGSVHKARPVWAYVLDSVKDCTPEWASEITGVDAGLIREACLVWATRPDGQPWGNGGIHFQLATDQIGEAFQCIRTLLYLSHLTTNADTPAGNRGPTRSPSLGAEGSGPLGPYSEAEMPPVDISSINVGDTYDMSAKKVSTAKFPEPTWVGAWTDATCAWRAAIDGEPYKIRGGWECAGTFMNQSNSALAWEALSGMEFWVSSNLWHHPVTEMADYLLPVTHWLENDFPRVSQGASGGIGANVRCIEPPADARYDCDVYTQFAKAMDYPWFDNPERTTWPENEEKLDVAIQSSAPALGGTPLCANWQEYKDHFQEHGWWKAKEVTPNNWGMYHRWENGTMRQSGGMFMMNTITDSLGFGWSTPTSRMEFWPVSFETVCINGPDATCTYDDMMPSYHESRHTPTTDPDGYAEYPFVVTTGRRIPVYFHSEHRQLPWCREQWPVPRMEINPDDAAELGLEQGDWAWIETPYGKIRQTVDLYYGIGKGTINLEHAWWFPELPGPTRGETLCDCNLLNDPDNQDHILGSTCMRGYLAKVYKATAENSPFNNPVPCAPEDGTPIITDCSDARLKAWLPNYDIRKEA